MAWIVSHQAVERHPKTLRLMDAMGWDLDTTVGKLHRFWWWCVDYAEDGDLRKHNDGSLGGAVGLNGDKAKLFVQSMVEACLLDREPYFRVHDWWEYFGPFLLAKYKRSPDKWMRVRKLYNSDAHGASNSSNPDYPPTHPPPKPNPPTNIPNPPTIPANGNGVADDGRGMGGVGMGLGDEAVSEAARYSRVSQLLRSAHVGKANVSKFANNRKCTVEIVSQKIAEARERPSVDLGAVVSSKLDKALGYKKVSQ